MVFSEEKNQKTFISSVASLLPAMAWMSEQAEKQKSFGSFLQKRTFLLLSIPASFISKARKTLLGLLLVASSVPVHAAPRLFIEDNDFLGPSGSNIQSVLPLLADPAIRVLGFTVVTGDGWCDEEAAYLLRFLEIAGHADVPVVKGAVFPLINTPSRMYAWETLYGTLPWKGAWNTRALPDYVPHAEKPYFIPPFPAGQPRTKPAPGLAADFLIAQVHRYPHQVTILEAGPMTNLALAIRLDPEFAGLAKQLVFMGGMLDNAVPQVTEDANFYTDFNLIFDPEAAHVVLTAPWAKITALGSVTNRSQFSPALVARMLQVKTPVTTFLATYAQTFPMWDEMAAAVAVDPTLVTKQVTARMDVDIAFGPLYGQARLWTEALAPHQGEQRVTVVQDVDMVRFYNAFIKAAQAKLP
jgi:inosine-uridine nucleoside N-ribohydrolase